MDFRTAIQIPPLAVRIDHSRSGLMLGSCFAENVASRMAAAGFRVTANPFGVLFNPASIALGMEYLASGRRFTQADLDTDGELWFSFAHHGSFASPDPAQALEAMNREAARGAQALIEADYAVLTLGTAWIYELADGRGVAANCHRQPSQCFIRRRMELEEVVKVLEHTIKKYLAGKHVILTVSPVRHLKDGLAENSRSKAILVEGCHRVAAACPGTEYFPAYEILTDDLRDYRFYDRDMVHPSAVAVDYVWERFCEAAMDGPARRLAAQAAQLAAAASHRPLHPGTPSEERFRSSMLARATGLQAAHPEADLAGIIKHFSR